MTFSLNVSFQGGGALLAVMIPVAHAISDTRKDGHIHLEGVAGSSAGSVAAALLAADADFKSLRKYINGELKADARQVAGPFFDGLNKFQQVSALWKAALGKELIPRNKLEQFFEQIFIRAKLLGLNKQNPNEDCSHLSHFGKDGRPRLLVTRSSLSDTGLDMPDDEDLLPCLVDSCSIPFLFTNYKTASEHPYVDGGLCENLPISGFDLEGDTGLIAVSISDDRTSDDNFTLKSFPLSLFSTSINYNVTKSKEIVGELMTIEETAPFTFSEISKAVEWIRVEANYDRVYNKTKRKLLDLAKYHALHLGDGKSINSRDTKALRDNHLKELLGQMHDPSCYEISETEFRVNAESLENPDAHSYRKMDLVTSTTVIKVKENFSFYKSYIPLEGGQFHPVTWRVTNLSRHRRSVSFTPFHYHDKADGGSKYDPCFIRFDKPDDFEPGHSLKIECIYAIKPSMTDLETDGRDYLNCANGHNVPVPLDIILVYPNLLGEVEFKPDEKRGKTEEFTPLSKAELAGRLGGDALSLSVAGVRSNGQVEPGNSLFVWVERVK